MNESNFFKLKDIQSKLNSPFPYKDTEKIYNDFSDIFSEIKKPCFNADFNQYCTTIAGTLSFVLKKMGNNSSKTSEPLKV